MVDILNTAISALQTYRRGLDTTSHNVANVDTAGYSRQRVDQATLIPQQYGYGYVGSGVGITSITRSYDEFTALQYRSTSTSLSREEVFASLANRINNLYADGTTGLSSTLQQFANAVQSVASAPSSMSARQSLLSQASSLASQMSSYSQSLEQIDAEVNGRLTSAVSDINSITSSIADLNGRIATAYGSTGQPPNDLLDQRDLLLDQLSEKIGINTVKMADGTVNVLVGNGQSLVIGVDAMQLSTQPDVYDASRLSIVAGLPGGPVDVTRNLTGGELGGVLDFRRNMLDPARNALGQLAIGVAGLVNGQQAKGMDLDGLAGTAVFGVGGVGVLPNAGNGGAATISVTRSDPAQITRSNYLLAFSGGSWSLRDANTGAAVAMTGTGTAANPFVADGLSFTVAGAAANGDSFLIRPTQDAAGGMSVRFTDPAKFAAALPVTASAAAANTGNGILGDLTVVDPTNANLRTTATITFPTAGTYSVNGGPAQAFSPGTTISANGWSLVLEGTPAAGDTFTIGNNSNGVGDNRNFLALHDSMTAGYMEGGKLSVNEAIGRIVSDVGVQTRQAQVSRDALQVVKKDTIATRDSVSGVNLDEEAANLVRYQQAYQAAAQVVQVANTIFDTLLGAIRR